MLFTQWTHTTLPHPVVTGSNQGCPTMKQNIGHRECLSQCVQSVRGQSIITGVTDITNAEWFILPLNLEVFTATVQFLFEAAKHKTNFFASRSSWRILRPYSLNKYNNLKLLSEIIKRNVLPRFPHSWRQLLSSSACEQLISENFRKLQCCHVRHGYLKPLTTAETQCRLTAAQ